MTRKFLTIPAVVAGALGMGSTIAWASEPTTQELMDQINKLQAKVAELENRQTTLSDAQVSATIESVLRDAEKRSQLFQMEGFTAGHDGKNFWLKSGDGRYSLSPRFQFQFRHVVNWRDDQKSDSDASTEKGFEIRRMKIAFVGTACSPDLEYNFRFAFDRKGGSAELENAYLQYQFNDQWAFKVGQWKDNVFHEESTSSEKQLAADRSLANELLAGGWTDYVQGASLLFNPKGTDGPIRAEIAAHDGASTRNTNFRDSGGTAGGGVSDPNWGASLRVEWAANNNFKGYEDFTARGNTEDVFVIGGGVNLTQAGSTNAYFHTVDVQWENTTGLGIYAAYLGHFLDNEDGDDVYNWGVVAQVGYMLNENFEIFGRVSWIDIDKDFVGDYDQGTTHEYTVGLNYYFCNGHDAKFTLDFGWLPEGSPVDIDGIGVLASDEDQFYVRGQFQLLI